MKLISEILKCTAKKGNISNLARGGFSENFIKKFNFRRLSIIPLLSWFDSTESNQFDSTFLVRFNFSGSIQLNRTTISSSENISTGTKLTKLIAEGPFPMAQKQYSSDQILFLCPENSTNWLT